MSEAGVSVRSSGSFDSVSVEKVDATPEEGLILLKLDPAGVAYCPSGLLLSVSIYHQTILHQLLDAAHPLYALLQSEGVDEVWLGPAQAPLRLVFSSERASMEGGARGLPLRALAFADLGTAETEDRARLARRSLDADGPGPGPSESTLWRSHGVALASITP